MNILNQADDPKPNAEGVYSVGLVYDSMDSTIELQVLRDLMALGAEFNVAVNDLGRRMSSELLDEAGIKQTTEPPVLNLVYKVIEDWPYFDPDVQVVKRDLQVKTCGPRLDSTPKPGYYLREQGRDGANLTELYLNRTAPRGNGLSDALVVLLWGA